MGRSLGRFNISGVLITIFFGSFEICIQTIVDLGQEASIVRGTFTNSKNGLPALLSPPTVGVRSNVLDFRVQAFLFQQLFLVQA